MKTLNQVVVCLPLPPLDGCCVSCRFVATVDGFIYVVGGWELFRLLNKLVVYLLGIEFQKYR